MPRHSGPSASQPGQATRVAREATGLELVAKADAVLEVLQDRGEATAADIADQTGEPLSSVYRLLQSLTGIGWVDRGWQRGTYRLGLALLVVGARVEDSIDIRECARPVLLQLLEVTGATSFLCVRRGTRAVCVERLEGYAVRSLAMQLGSSLPLYVGAAPRAILSFLPPAEQRSALRPVRMPGDPGRPEPASIQADIERVKEAGYVVSDGDVTPGIAALGAPVFNHRGELEAAISISGIRSQVVGASRQRNIDLILDGAREVSRALGFEEAS